MRRLERSRTRAAAAARRGNRRGRPLPREASEPQPEHAEPRPVEPRPAEPRPAHLPAREYAAIFTRAFKKFRADQMTTIAAALAYYAFLAIPSVLLVVVGLFSLLAGPQAIDTVVDKLQEVMPGEATSLIRDSLRTMTEDTSTGIGVLGIGCALALWSLTGAMQNVMWAVNVAYGRKESRGFLRRRVTALWMVCFALIGFALSFGALVLGPHVSGWVGSAVGAKDVVTTVWWIAEWPVLLVGLLVVFAGLMYLAPNVRHPRWELLTFGAIVSLALWLVASGAFSFYVSRFGSYNKTWGSLSAVVVMLTWLWLSSVALLLGAEVNAEAERRKEG